MISRILAEEGIEEIPVKTGDKFSSTNHKRVESRPDSSLKSSVLEITRKGYWIKSENGEDIVLRPTDVIVSSGTSVK